MNFKKISVILVLKIVKIVDYSNKDIETCEMFNLRITITYGGRRKYNMYARNRVVFVSFTRSRICIYFIHLFSFTKETNRPIVARAHVTAVYLTIKSL